MANQLYVIKCFGYVSKLGDVSVFIDHSLSGLQHKVVRDEALRRWMNGVPELVRNKKFYVKEPPEEVFQRFEKQMEDSFLKKLDSSGVIILNMSLVTLCTIVEIFFDHMLKAIFDANPRTLLSISPYKDITLDHFLDFKDYGEVLEDFKERFLEHFNRQGIEKKLEFLNKIGLKKEQLFSWKMFNEETQKKLAGVDGEALVDVFNKRHAIVHNNVLSISTFDELLEIKDFLAKVVLNFSLEAAEKFSSYGVVTDFQVMAQGLMQSG